jgi:hypothetical protein
MVGIVLRCKLIVGGSIKVSKFGYLIPNVTFKKHFWITQLSKVLKLISSQHWFWQVVETLLRGCLCSTNYYGNVLYVQQLNLPRLGFVGSIAILG